MHVLEIEGDNLSIILNFVNFFIHFHVYYTDMFMLSVIRLKIIRNRTVSGTSSRKIKLFALASK